MCSVYAALNARPTIVMLFTQLFFIMLSVLAGSAVARNGCRQCRGQRTINFKNSVSIEDATAYLKFVLSDCATANEFDILGCSPSQCLDETMSALCKTYYFSLRIWRYCGNGGNIDFKQQNICHGNVCLNTDHLFMECTRSVDCRSKCTCSMCGC